MLMHEEKAYYHTSKLPRRRPRREPLAAHFPQAHPATFVASNIVVVKGCLRVRAKGYHPRQIKDYW